jgi:hypothetical protein
MTNTGEIGHRSHASQLKMTNGGIRSIRTLLTRTLTR